MPDLFADPENFVPANLMETPAHIQPEWYFLFAYAILRSIPRKDLGVLALLCSVFVLFIPSALMLGYSGPISLGMNKVRKIIFWRLVFSFAGLT